MWLTKQREVMVTKTELGPFPAYADSQNAKSLAASGTTWAWGYQELLLLGLQLTVCFNRFPGACTAQHSYNCHLLRETSDEGWSLFLFLMRRSKAASSTQYLAQWGLKSARISETSEKVSQDPWWSKIGDGCAMECEYTTDERWHTTQKKPHRTVLAHVDSSCLF